MSYSASLASERLEFCGIAFPKTSATERSTQIAGKNAYCAAIGAMSPQEASKARGEKCWRFGYAKHVLKSVELSAVSGKEALLIAQTGLDYCYQNFEFIRDGQSISLDTAMKTMDKSFYTGFIRGSLEKPSTNELVVPYKGKALRGKSLLEQIDQWTKYGTMEPSCGHYLKMVVQHKEWCDLSNQYFVLLGAGSAMGPFKTLMSFGAHVIAINSQRPETWKRLIEITRASSGTLTFPLSVEQNDMNDEMLCEKAGCDLLTQTPEIKNWLNEVYPDKEFIIGSYSYLDGEAYVRVSLAMDAILMQVCSKRKIKGIAYLNTPTLCYLIPNEAAQASVNNYYKPSIFNTIMMPLRLLAPRLADRNIRTTATTEDGKKEYIVNGLVLAQGPNYALAKSIQLWRSIIAKEKGFLVSSNIAPATKTVSVVHNRKFAWAYNGYHYFEPIEIFEPETSSALMCALLINDINNEDSCSSPKKILPQLWDLFKDGALHGGVWRSGYSLQSTGEIAALMYFYEKLKPFLVVLFALFASVYFTTSSKSA